MVERAHYKSSISQLYLRNVLLRDIHDWHEIVYSIYMYITNRDKENHLCIHFHLTKILCCDDHHSCETDCKCAQ